MVMVVLHCSASNFGNAALIEQWHLARGWQGIGYHYVILNGWIASGCYHAFFDGHIETGRPMDDDPFVSGQEQGAHVRGHNKQSVGICLIGQSGQFTDRQLNSALQCVLMLERQFKDIDIVQHSDLDPAKPDCAGLNMALFNKNYQIYREIVNEGEPSGQINIA